MSLEAHQELHLVHSQTEEDVVRSTLIDALFLSHEDAAQHSTSKLAELVATKILNLETKLHWLSPGESPHR